MTQFMQLLSQPKTLHYFIGILVFLYGLIRGVAFSGMGGDEAEQVLFAQTLEWGYDVTNPPLYTWLVIGLFSIFGKSIALMLTLKMTVLGLIYVSLYHAARLTLGPGRALDWGLVALSPLLIFFISWHSIFSYSHSLLNALFVILTYIVFIRTIESGKLFWFILLGLIMGFGILTKYSYGMFLGALIVAALTLAPTRKRVLSMPMFGAICLSIAIAAPHFVWLYESLESLQKAVAYKFQINDQGSYISNVGKGLWSLVRTYFAFLSPLWIILILVFPGVLKKRAADTEPMILKQLLARTFIIVFIILCLMVVVGGITKIRPNYLFMMVLLPVLAFAHIPAENTPGKRRRIYAGILAITAILSLGGVLGKAVIGPQTCKKCPLEMPYPAIAKALIDQGMGRTAIRAHWHPNALAGNLSIYMPDAFFLSTKFRHRKVPESHHGYTCSVVWMGFRRVGPIGPDDERIPQEDYLTQHKQTLTFALPRAPKRIVTLHIADWIEDKNKFDKYCK